MPCQRVGPAIVCTSDQHEHTFNGRTWRFDLHRYSGPWPIKRNGEPYAKVPSTFWAAWEDWLTQ
jgi:hypothetical protein